MRLLNQLLVTIFLSQICRLINMEGACSFCLVVWPSGSQGPCMLPQSEFQMRLVEALQALL